MSPLMNARTARRPVETSTRRPVGRSMPPSRRLPATPGLRLVLVTLLALAATAGTLGAQQQQQPDDAPERQSSGPVVPHPEAQEAISRLKSPFCPGLMLEVCPSPQAAAVRDTLRRMAEDGADADSLVSWFLASYGEEWRGVPETRGRGLLAWVVPPAMLLLGAVLVVVALRRLRGGGAEAASGDGGSSLTPEDEQRLDEALRELERGGR